MGGAGRGREGPGAGGRSISTFSAQHPLQPADTRRQASLLLCPHPGCALGPCSPALAASPTPRLLHLASDSRNRLLEGWASAS